MTRRGRVLRQRVWSDGEDGKEKADARAVGESLRNAESAILGQPRMRIVTFADQVYAGDGVSFASTSCPLAVLNVYSEKVDGLAQSTSTTSEWKFAGSTVTAKLPGLVAGTRYATIRLLVIG